MTVQKTSLPLLTAIFDGKTKNSSAEKMRPKSQSRPLGYTSKCIAVFVILSTVRCCRLWRDVSALIVMRYCSLRRVVTTLVIVRCRGVGLLNVCCSICLPSRVAALIFCALRNAVQSIKVSEILL